MFNFITNLFKFGRSRRFLGVDIGTVGVRIVELSKRGSYYKLENYGGIETSSINENPFRRVFKNNTIALSDKQIAKAIQLICNEAGMEFRQASFAIPDFCSFFTSFNLPMMTTEEIPQAVQYEARPYIPLPLAEVVLDWTVIEGEPGKTPLKVLVVAIPKDTISQYQGIAKLAGLELKTLESEVFALARSLNLNQTNNRDKKIIALIDIGARSSTCSIIEKGTVRTSYSFNIAGNELTEVITNSLNIDYKKAEEKKKEYGLKPDNGNNIREILIPLVDSILVEIKNVLRNFYLEEGKEVEAFFLSGGQVLAPGLKEYFSDSLKKPVFLVNPFSGLIYSESLKEELEKIGPLYAISVGLAMKGLED